MSRSSRVLGVAPDGVVYVSSDRGARWARRGQVPEGSDAIATSGDADVYIATDDAIQHSGDNGATLTVFQRVLGHGGLARDEAFNEAEFESLDLFDVESGGADLVKGPTNEVFPAQRHGEDLQSTLYAARDA